MLITSRDDGRYSSRRAQEEEPLVARAQRMMIKCALVVAAVSAVPFGGVDPRNSVNPLTSVDLLSSLDQQSKVDLVNGLLANTSDVALAARLLQNASVNFEVHEEFFHHVTNFVNSTLRERGEEPSISRNIPSKTALSRVHRSEAKSPQLG